MSCTGCTTCFREKRGQRATAQHARGPVSADGGWEHCGNQAERAITGRSTGRAGPQSRESIRLHRRVKKCEDGHSPSGAFRWFFSLQAARVEFPRKGKVRRVPLPSDSQVNHLASTLQVTHTLKVTTLQVTHSVTFLVRIPRSSCSLIPSSRRACLSIPHTSLHALA